jgi:hypothetical protein
LLLKDPRDGRFYLHVFDGWLTAREVIGPWQMVTGDTSRLDEVKVRSGGGEVELLEGGAGRPSLKSGAPVIYLSTTPAELIVLTGEPQLEPITGTQLLWVKNTAAPLLLDTGSDHYFAVISGRWFRAQTLNGPWGFAPPDQLPGDIALIPDQHALAPVRAAVPGTPQAREAVIANSVPQTATVRRTEARFEPTIDGEAQLRSIEGTSLLHVTNSPTPIIRVAADRWYAVDRGVWFTARALDGPWEIATWVPQVIYDIPATSPLHYVTYVKVYGATPDEVFTGYTPGYLGTVVAPAGTVVQGTGAFVSPWIGNVWFGTPWTYGFGWSVGVGTFWPTWNPWCCSPWWGPAWGGWWRPPVWAWGPRPGWGWGPRPGWGPPPPAWGWSHRPGWGPPPPGRGWGPRPGWAGWRPPIYHPPLLRPPVAFPPGGRPPGGFPPPGVRPPGGFAPPGARPLVALPPPGRPQPASPIGPSWGQPASGRGPGWGQAGGNRGPGWNVAPTVPGAWSPHAGPVAPPAVAAPAFPQTFRHPPQMTPPRVGGMATPVRPFGAPMIAPGAGPSFRSGGQPIAPPSAAFPQRGPTAGFPAPGAAPVPGNYPRFNAPPSAVPRAYGGSPAAPAMAPRFGGPTPGAGVPIGGFRGGPPTGVGAPAGGFRGAPMAPRGPGWGGAR